MYPWLYGSRVPLFLWLLRAGMVQTLLWQYVLRRELLILQMDRQQMLLAALPFLSLPFLLEFRCKRRRVSSWKAIKNAFIPLNTE